MISSVDANFFFPVHPNLTVQTLSHQILESAGNISLMPPLEYPEFLSLLNSAALVLTDSGGVQEEASHLGKSVFILRDTSERDDALEAGKTKIMGTDSLRIFQEIDEHLKAYSASVNLQKYEHGSSASDRIANGVAARCS